MALKCEATVTNYWPSWESVEFCQLLFHYFLLSTLESLVNMYDGLLFLLCLVREVNDFT